MKKMFIVGTTLLVATLVVSGCNDSKDKAAKAAEKSCPFSAKGGMGGTAGDVCPVSTPSMPAKGMAIMAEPIEGTVLQTLPAGRYVYVELNTKSGSVWVASVAATVTNGEKIVCRPETEMVNFESPILKRKFDKVYFVGSLKDTGSVAMPDGHPTMMPAGHGTKATEGAAHAKVDVTSSATPK